MNFLRNKIVPLIVTALLLGSCTIERRQFLHGFYIGKTRPKNFEMYFVQRAKIKPEKTFTTAASKNEPLPVNNFITQCNYTLTAFNEKNQIQSNLGPISFHKDYDFPKFIKIQNEIGEYCDVLLLRNGQEIFAKVFEIGQTEIIYKKCDNPNGPTISIRKSEVISIKYSNGTKDIIANNKSSNSKGAKEDKSLVGAILIWFFLGLIGIHRFYLGHIGIGILYLLTGGLCGIGWIIDGILFLTGDLKPKHGVYYDEF